MVAGQVGNLSGILVESGIPVTVILVVDCNSLCYRLNRFFAVRINGVAGNTLRFQGLRNAQK